MKLLVDVSEKDYLAFMLQYDNHVLDDKTPSHRAKIAIAEGTPLPKCMNCKFFEYDFVSKGYYPLILSHEVCKKWGDGCKTKEDGYCFLFEAKEGVENEANLHDRSE